MSQYSTVGSTPNVNVAAIAASPTDRVRWGPIIAGLFAALSTLAVLGVLGIAVGASAYDPGDNARNFGIGAGIWGAVSALLAFFIGGWLAARAAAVRGKDNGVLNGSMVWVAAIPLLLYVLMGGIGMAARTAGNAANSAAQAASNVAGGAASDPTARERVEGEARQASAKLEADAKDAANRASAAIKDPRNQEKAADTTAKSAWGTLVSMLLGLGAAAAGGLVGARGRHTDVHRDHSAGHDTTVSNTDRA
ncbi:MAG TPA: hypothetical protein VEA69_25825 [Tepidisphaeraceae bacterium]|nr:hypothetical protein [Tepidisphaeraceae bacterium]